MENASITLNIKTMFFSNGVPYEDLKGVLKDQGIKNTLSECRKDVEALFPQTIQAGAEKSPGVALFTLVYELIKMAKEHPERLLSNADSLRIMLPLITKSFPHSNPLADSYYKEKDNVRRVKSLLKDVLKQQETMRVLNAYRQVVNKSLNRSDTHNINEYSISYNNSRNIGMCIRG